MTLFSGNVFQGDIHAPYVDDLLIAFPTREHPGGLSASSHISWTLEAEESFVNLKNDLQTTPTLDGRITSVLLQRHGFHLKPVALPHCLHADAAAEKAVLALRDFVVFFWSHSFSI
uniref:Uncharacterized protein n=1 Tax=Mola mola TaxID=94237 RepID=A0A3Q3VVQ3_MOLML